MILEKALKSVGLTLEADALPQADRTVKSFRRVIAAIRACEAEVQDRLSEAERELNDSLRANLTLQERCRASETELMRYKLKEHLQGIEALTTADKTKLLEVAA